mgnify:FL=1
MTNKIPAAASRKVQRPVSERVMMVVITIFMVLFCFCTLYPFINTLAISFNEGPDTLKGGIYFVPRIFTFQNYEEIFSDSSILSAYTITILRTVIGTVFTLMFTGLLAYGLSKKYLRGRKFYMVLCTFAMIFNAGLIPTYMLYRDAKLINNFWVYILPAAVNIWDMILMKNFFQQLPEEVEESAEIDGAGTMRIFFSIVIPISMPIIATIAIFSAVGQWNSWYDAYIFCTTRTDLHPIQTYLYKVIALSQATSSNAAESQLLARLKTNVTTIRAATVVITILPIIFIYCLFQKHFIKGVMVGSLKG